VLVILGLLVGGVLAGKSLIRAAELRSIATDINNYQVALNGFKDKYFSLPGDMANATQFWGSGGCAGAGTGTCDGDGNGQVFRSNEGAHVWDQLGRAGLIAGGLRGANNSFTAGIRIPVGKITSSAFGIEYGGPYYGATQNYIMFGKSATSTNGFPDDPLLKAEDSYTIDMKMDDGVPYSGKLRAIDTTNASIYCLTGVFTGAGPFSNTYILASSTIACRLHYML
jgi:hypothetical protein